MISNLLNIIKNLNNDDRFDSIDYPMLFDNELEIFKSGGKIHIKKKNRGKFTKSAKKAGQSVQEYAKSVLNNPNSTTLQKKRANFAIQAKRWHKK